MNQVLISFRNLIQFYIAYLYHTITSVLVNCYEETVVISTNHNTFNIRSLRSYILFSKQYKV